MQTEKMGMRCNRR